MYSYYCGEGVCRLAALECQLGYAGYAQQYQVPPCWCTASAWCLQVKGMQEVEVADDLHF